MRRTNSITRLLILCGVPAITFAAIQHAGIEPYQRVTTSEARLPTRRQIEQDLQLRVELDPRCTSVQAGGEPWVKATLVNTSKTRTHRVVKPGHGSEIGTREPHFHWTATLDRGDGPRTPVPGQRIGYCGTCLSSASVWERSWTVLRAGGQLDLGSGPLLEFQKVGRVRLQAHYDFSGDRGSRVQRRDQLGLFAFVPAFHLDSDPVEFEVVRPLEVRVEVKGRLKANEKTRLSELLDITLVNQSAGSTKCSMPTRHSPGGRVYLEIEGEYGGWRPEISEERAVYADEDVVLKPGARVPLIGKGDFANGLDGFWEYPKKGVVRLRVGYNPNVREYAPTVLSEWVEVQVID